MNSIKDFTLQEHQNAESEPFVADGTNWYGSYTQGYTP
jgi:hypothetical protein